MTATTPHGTLEDLIEDAGDAPYHTILQVWAEVLKPAHAEATSRVTPAWAGRIVSSYPGVLFADMQEFKSRYLSKIYDLEGVLQEVISEDPECLSPTASEEDLELNTFRYLDIILSWQKLFLQWEVDWQASSPEAAAELAAIAEVHKMFFGDQGLASLLDQIGFQFTDAHRELLEQELEEFRKSLHA